MDWWLMIKVFIFISSPWKLANVLKWFCVPFMKHNFSVQVIQNLKDTDSFINYIYSNQTWWWQLFNVICFTSSRTWFLRVFFTTLKIWSRNFWRTCWSFYKLNWNQFVDEINSGSNFVWSSFKHFLQNTFFDS